MERCGISDGKIVIANEGMALNPFVGWGRRLNVLMVVLVLVVMNSFGGPVLNDLVTSNVTKAWELDER